MGTGFNTTFSLTTAVVDHFNRRRAKKRINRLNEQSRNILLVGRSTPDQIIPCNFQMGNIIISGGTEDARNALIVQNCKQSTSVGVPTVIIHEGNYLLEQHIQTEFSGHRYLRIINSSNSYYEPLFRLSDTEIGHLIADSSLKGYEINSSGALYISALATILRKRGITPYTRMFMNCPHGSINNMIATMEQSGVLNIDEADSLRSAVSIDTKDRADVECFFQQLELESQILAWKSNLYRCTSISECVSKSGIISIDISSCGRLNQLSLISAEINKCAKSGIPFRVIVDAVSISGSEQLIKTLKCSSNTVAWTITSPDINRMLGSIQGELPTWLAFSHKAILFSHGIKTCELLSAELGEYDCIEISESRAGNNNIGRIGYHYGTNSGISTSIKRKPVIQPEELESLGTDGFIMLDNYTATISKGVLI